MQADPRFSLLTETIEQMNSLSFQIDSTSLFKVGSFFPPTNSTEVQPLQWSDLLDKKVELEDLPAG